MATKGFKRYVRLCQHIANPSEYIMHKCNRRHRSLTFTTRPLPVHFQVPEPLYQVFKELFMQDVYEIDELVARLPTQPIVIDIGANVGFFAVQLMSKLEGATIYAYEPMPANSAAFQRTLDDNPRLKNNVNLFQMAVTGSPLATVTLFTDDLTRNQVVASAFATFHENNKQTFEAPCITLNDIVMRHELRKIDLLKVDCEGGEYDIFYNTDPAILARINNIVMEVHDIDTNQLNIKALNTYLQSVGFQTEYVPINSFCHSLKGSIKNKSL